ncbi:MAG: DUF4399 domain-containing protein [Methylibium sp.]|nr:DUF4399 domain-containing protein [Methylibium sp.]
MRSQQPETYFTNLRDGDRIETPFLLKFGLARYGLAPIVKKVPGAGHHHLLVNRELPLDLKQPLPFNDQYIHFGKGQMETVLSLAPGEHTLRLLLADDKHIPYFVYSKPLRFTVTSKNGDVDPKSLVKPGVEILEPRSGESLRPPLRVRLHASGLNVGHADVRDAGVGHFRLVAERTGAPPERIELTNGQTEVWLAPPDGRYKLRVELVANDGSQSVMAVSTPIELGVARQEIARP